MPVRPFHDRPALVALLLAAIAVAVTWPLASHLGSVIPGNLGDPLLNTWTLAWGSDRLAAGLDGFWDGRAFFPHTNTVALSEHLLGVAIFVAPVYWVSDNPVLTYNVAYLASFVHAGLAMWLLVRRLTGRTDVALVAALAFAFPLLRTTGQHTFLHMQVSGWVPLTFWALHRYGERRRAGDALLAAAACVLAVLTSLYFAFVLVVPLAYAAVVLLRPWTRPTLPRVVGHGVLAAVGAAVILVPILLRYQRISAEHGFERTALESARYSAHVLSYLSVWHQSNLRPFLRDESTVVQALFPGVVILALAAAAWQPRRLAGPVSKVWDMGAPAFGLALCALAAGRVLPAVAGSVGLALLAARVCLPLPASPPALYGRVAALAFLLSLGPFPSFAGEAMATSGPHAWTIGLLPGASAVRMPARHGLMVAFALAVLCGYGAIRVLDARWVRRRTAGAALALTALAALVVADGYGGPLPLAPIEPFGSAQDRKVHAWIASRGPGPVMHLPIADTDFGRPEVANASVQLTFHYATLLHGQPTVTGGTDFMPLFARWLHGDGSSFRSPPHGALGLDLLRRLGVRYVLVHRDEFRTTGEAEAFESALLRGRSHVRARTEFGTILGLELRDALQMPAASAPPPERGPPQRVHCRYLDAGSIDPAHPAPDVPAPSVAATWICPVPGGPLHAVQWTFDLGRPETWPTHLRVQTAGGPGNAPPLLDLSLTARLADAMLARPSSAPQIVTPLQVIETNTLVVRTWGARAPRSTPPFWLEAWVGGR